MVVIYLAIYVNIGYILAMWDCSAILLCVWSYKNGRSGGGIFVILMVIYMIYMYMATILIAVFIQGTKKEERKTEKV